MPELDKLVLMPLMALDRTNLIKLSQSPATSFDNLKRRTS